MWKRKRNRTRSSSRSTISTNSSSDSSSTDSRRPHYKSYKERKSRKRNSKRSYTPPVSLVSTSNLPLPMSNTTLRNMESVNFIPEFDPLICQVDQWLEIIEHNSKNYAWPDNFTVYQALTKLRGTAHIWYTSYIESEPGWSQLGWSQWKSILRDTFQSSQNTYNIFMDIAHHKPKIGSSLYEFYFAHTAKINKLRVNFSNSDKVSLIIGAINDENITSAVEAAGIKEPNLLASYLKNKYYKPTRVLSDPTCNFNEAAPSYASYKVSHNTGKHKNIEQCTCCGSFGHVKQTCRHRNKVCRFCKYAGHVEKNCWKKKDLEQTNNANVNPTMKHREDTVSQKNEI